MQWRCTTRQQPSAPLILPREVRQASFNDVASTQTNSSTIFAIKLMWCIPQCCSLLSMFFTSTLLRKHIYGRLFWQIIYNHNISLFSKDFLRTELSCSRPPMERFTMSRPMIRSQHWCSFQSQGSNKLWLINPYRHVSEYMQHICCIYRIVGIFMLCPKIYVRFMESVRFKSIYLGWYRVMH